MKNKKMLSLMLCAVLFATSMPTDLTAYAGNIGNYVQSNGKNAEDHGDHGTEGDRLEDGAEVTSPSVISKTPAVDPTETEPGESIETSDPANTSETGETDDPGATPAATPTTSAMTVRPFRTSGPALPTSTPSVTIDPAVPTSPATITTPPSATATSPATITTPPAATATSPGGAKGEPTSPASPSPITTFLPDETSPALIPEQSDNPPTPPAGGGNQPPQGPEAPVATPSPTASPSFHISNETETVTMTNTSEHGQVCVIKKGKSDVLTVTSSTGGEPSAEYSSQWTINEAAQDSGDTPWRMVVTQKNPGVYDYVCKISKDGAEVASLSVKVVVYKSETASVELGKSLDIKKSVFGNASALTNETLTDIEVDGTKGSITVSGSTLKAKKLLTNNVAKNKANKCNYKGKCKVSLSVFGVSFEMTLNVKLPKPKMTLKKSNGDKTLTGIPKAYGADSISLQLFALHAKKWMTYKPMSSKFQTPNKKGTYHNSAPLKIKKYRIRAEYKSGSKTYHTDWVKVKPKK